LQQIKALQRRRRRHDSATLGLKLSQLKGKQINNSPTTTRSRSQRVPGQCTSHQRFKIPTMSVRCTTPS